eukprot:scaffold24930_cov69-Phaeocystis_antarctica.AAC.3
MPVSVSMLIVPKPHENTVAPPALSGVAASMAVFWQSPLRQSVVCSPSESTITTRPASDLGVCEVRRLESYALHLSLSERPLGEARLGLQLMRARVQRSVKDLAGRGSPQLRPPSTCCGGPRPQSELSLRPLQAI